MHECVNACVLDRECEDETAHGQKALQFGGQAPKDASDGKGRHSFFRARHLEAVQTF